MNLENTDFDLQTSAERYLSGFCVGSPPRTAVLLLPTRWPAPLS
jgi:hypothetical protein